MHINRNTVCLMLHSKERGSKGQNEGERVGVHAAAATPMNFYMPPRRYAPLRDGVKAKERVVERQL